MSEPTPTPTPTPNPTPTPEVDPLAKFEAALRRMLTALMDRVPAETVDISLTVPLEDAVKVLAYANQLEKDREVIFEQQMQDPTSTIPTKTTTVISSDSLTTSTTTIPAAEVTPQPQEQEQEQEVPEPAPAPPTSKPQPKPKTKGKKKPSG